MEMKERVNKRCDDGDREKKLRAYLIFLFRLCISTRQHNKELA